MEIGKWLGQVLREPGRLTRAGHRVPLVTDPAGIQNERKLLIGPGGGSERRSGHEPRAAVRVLETCVFEQASSSRVPRPGYGPLNRLELLVLLRSQPREAADVEDARIVVIRGRQGGGFR